MFLVYGLRFTVYRLLFTVYGLLFTVCGLLFTVYCLLFVVGLMVWRFRGAHPWPLPGGGEEVRGVQRSARQ